jgi:hypothetical protein
MEGPRRQLTFLFADIEHADEMINALAAQALSTAAMYKTRTELVYLAFGLAARLGYEVGVRFDTDETNAAQWPVFCITLPGQGQVSWHCAAYPHAYDGHSTNEKYQRIRAHISDLRSATQVPPTKQ